MFEKEYGGRFMSEMRRRDRQVTDLAEIKEIVEKNMILHLGLLDKEFPYVVPLHYGYEYDEGKNQFIFYMHGAKQGHKIDLIHQNPNACIQIEGEVIPDYDHEIPCKYGAFFTSFIGRGKAELLEKHDEKAHALNQLMQHQTGKRFEFTENMTKPVAVIKVVVTDYSAKAKKMKSAK